MLRRRTLDAGLAAPAGGPRRPPQTTKPAVTPDEADGLHDLVARHFVGMRPNTLWVADLTYVATRRGFVYVVFVIDVFSRRIVAWWVATSLQSDLALDALEHAIAERQPNAGPTAATRLVHQSERGVQSLAIRYTGPGCWPAGLSHPSGDQATRTTTRWQNRSLGSFKTEVIHRRAPWRSLEDVELATLEWVWWFNHRCLLEPLGYLPPAEFEAHFHDMPVPHLVAAVLRIARPLSNPGRFTHDPVIELLCVSVQSARSVDHGASI